MNINDYIEKLRNKPVHQRERIVIAATAVSFLIILVIWLVSFSEMNKEGQADANPSAVDQLNGLKSNVGESKKSIESMRKIQAEQTALAGLIAGKIPQRISCSHHLLKRSRNLKIIISKIAPFHNCRRNLWRLDI